MPPKCEDALCVPHQRVSGQAAEPNTTDEKETPVYTAKHIMTENVISIPSGTTVEETIRTLLDRRISGAPVVDAAGRLIGIISEFEMMELIYDPAMKHAEVDQFMTRDVISVGEQTMLNDIVNIMMVMRIRRVPVTRNDRVVGLISRPDLVRYALDAGTEIAEYLKDAFAAAGMEQPSLT